MNEAILMVEDVWRNSQLSIARHYGGIRCNGIEFLIVNKEGKDLLECSAEAEKAGRDKAIEPGEPADLVRADFIPYYKKLGRDRFIKVLEENPNVTVEKLKSKYNDELRKK